MLLSFCIIFVSLMQFVNEAQLVHIFLSLFLSATIAAQFARCPITVIVLLTHIYASL